MSTEENKAVIRRAYEEFNKGKEAAIAALEELCAPTMSGMVLAPFLRWTWRP
jgi:hypothetical protein